MKYDYFHLIMQLPLFPGSTNLAGRTQLSPFQCLVQHLMSSELKEKLFALHSYEHSFTD